MRTKPSLSPTSGTGRTGELTAVRPARRAARIIVSAMADPLSPSNPRLLVIGGQLARTVEQLSPVSGNEVTPPATPVDPDPPTEATARGPRLAW
jgi:hypothetical protein